MRAEGKEEGENEKRREENDEGRARESEVQVPGGVPVCVGDRGSHQDDFVRDVIKRLRKCLLVLSYTGGSEKGGKKRRRECHSRYILRKTSR